MLPEVLLVQAGVNNVIVQQEKVALKVSTHRLVFEYNVSTPDFCQGKSVDFIPFWYMTQIETTALSRGKALLQLSLRDFCNISLILPNVTEAKAITQVFVLLMLLILQFIKGRTQKRITFNKVEAIPRDTHKNCYYAAQTELTSHGWVASPTCKWKPFDWSTVSAVASPYQSSCLLWSRWNSKVNFSTIQY
jgi:hypothetical protein